MTLGWWKPAAIQMQKRAAVRGNNSNRDESRISDPRCRMEGRRSTDRKAPGDNRLISPKSSPSTASFSMSAHRILEAGLRSRVGLSAH